MSFKIKLALYIGLGIAVVFAVLLVTGVIKPFQPETIKGDIVVWDKDPRNNVLRDFFSQYQSQFPGIKITYEVKNPETYERDLLDALAAGTGPDIFALDSREIAIHKNKIAPLASDNQLAAEFLAKAPDAVLADLTDDKDSIYGMLWSVDTLALFYNKDYLNASNIAEPPKTWDEFREASRRLTRRSPTGAIQRSGASFGLGRNVAHAADIFSALVMQSGNPIFTASDKRFHFTDTVVVEGESRAPAASALKFYTDFANPNSPYYTWNSSQPESREAFALGKAAFFLGYARDLPAILAQNPHLNFAVAPLPQLTIGDRISYASYDFLTVSKSSRALDIAWAILTSMYQKDVAKTIIDTLVLPPAHRDLIGSKPPNKILQPWYDQVLSARTWEVPNRETARRILRDMFDASVSGGLQASEALNRMQSQLQSIVDRAK